MSHLLWPSFFWDFIPPLVFFFFQYYILYPVYFFPLLFSICLICKSVSHLIFTSFFLFLNDGDVVLVLLHSFPAFCWFNVDVYGAYFCHFPFTILDVIHVIRSILWCHSLVVLVLGSLTFLRAFSVQLSDLFMSSGLIKYVDSGQLLQQLLSQL